MGTACQGSFGNGILPTTPHLTGCSFFSGSLPTFFASITSAPDLSAAEERWLALEILREEIEGG